jgi:hypothetical protein
VVCWGGGLNKYQAFAADAADSLWWAAMCFAMAAAIGAAQQKRGALYRSSIRRLAASG